MKALTLTQPWATLVAIGAKRIETRVWRSSYRGPLAIHAAKGFPRSARDFHYAMVSQQFGIDIGELPLGCVIATARLTDCVPMESEICLPGVFEDYPELDTPQERSFGDFSVGRWAWILEDVQQLSQPIPAKGALSLWECAL